MNSDQLDEKKRAYDQAQAASETRSITDGELAYRITVKNVPAGWRVGTIIRDVSAPNQKPVMIMKLHADGADVIPMSGNRKQRRTFIAKNRSRA